MTRKQTRKSVSISGELYDVLAERAKKTEGGISSQVEDVMRDHVGLPPRGAPDKEASSSKPAVGRVEKPKSRFFTNELRLQRPTNNPTAGLVQPRNRRYDPNY